MSTSLAHNKLDEYNNRLLHSCYYQFFLPNASTVHDTFKYMECSFISNNATID